MRVAPHHHACQRCGAKTQCPGTWEENYDGFPEVICAEFHLAGGEVNADFVCEGCSCVDCGERGEVMGKDYTGPDTYVDVLRCESCQQRYENREPRELSFDEALGAVCDARNRIEEARRLK